MTRTTVVIVLFAALMALERAQAQEPPAAWTPAPWLLLDEQLIEKSEGLTREVNHPSRLPDPVVTGFEDGCQQPWFTVIRDPETRRFRIWFNVPIAPGNKDERNLAYMESEDGIHWIRPHRILKMPTPVTGASVIDEGPGCPDPARRFKFGWWRDGGLKIATSPDGLNWTPISDGVVLPMNHDITAIDWDPIRGRYMALVSHVDRDGPLANLRIPHESVSDDLMKWKKPWPIITPDRNADIEKGETQFYGISAAIARGPLLIGMVKVLRDDKNCEPDRTAAQLHDDQKRRFAGIGYTVVAWSRDGEHWQRDTQPFLDRNAQPGTWDRAMAWADDQMVVGDHTYVYYGGYRWGHKAARLTGRQIGFAHMPRDRYAGYTAGANAGHLLTRSATLNAKDLTVNARIDFDEGSLRARILDGQNHPYPGFDFADCTPIQGDRVDHPVKWKADLQTLQSKPVRFDFELKQGTIYGFDLKQAQ